MDRATLSELQRLMERLADGDRAAFHPVFAVLWPLLRRFAARQLRPEGALGALRPEDAETLRLYARGHRPAVAAATFRKRIERAMARLRGIWRTTDGRP